MASNHQIPKHVWVYVGSFILYLGVLLARNAKSLGRIPADPGYSYIQDGAGQGIRSLLYGDPYYHIAARAVAWVVSWFPLSTHAILLTTLTLFVWANCGLTVLHVVRLETKSLLFGMISGLVLITAPHAAESGFTVGNLKWPLLGSLLIGSASRRALSRTTKSTTCLMVVTGFTNPLTVICLVPLTMHLLRPKINQSLTFRLSGACLLIFSLQLLKVGGFGGHSTKVTMPWNGMGLFWWSGLLGPVIVAVLTLIVLIIQYLFKRGLDEFPTVLSVTAVLLASASYQMGGIADRYFFTPMAMSTLAALLTLRSLDIHIHLRQALWVLAAISLLIPTVKWFSTSWYMTSGPTWKSEVDRVRELCTADSDQVVSLAISPDGTTELACSYVLRE